MSKILNGIVVLLFTLLSLPMISAQAAVYNIMDYMPLISGASTGERVYFMDDPYAYPITKVINERSAGILAARPTFADTSAATVPTQLIQSSDGSDAMWTIDTNGLVQHGSKDNGVLSGYSFSHYFYDFITAPATAALATQTDFDVTNLTTPTPSLPFQVDTNIQSVFTHTYASIYDEQGTSWLDYGVQTITVDDNAGALHDLSNPAHPDYDQNLTSMWDVASGGSGVSVLQNLLKITIHNEYTDILYGGFFVSDEVMYLAAGVGVVYRVSDGVTASLLGYTIGGASGAVGGLSQAVVQVQDVYGAPVSGGYASAEAVFIDPYTGVPTIDYSTASALEEVPGSGQYKLYFGTGDVLDVSVKGAGYAPEFYPSQDLYTLAAASAPAPLVYAVTTPLSVLTGTVLDPLGLPVQGANVSVQIAEGLPPGVPNFWYFTVGSASTDVYGSYSVEVAQGQYVVNIDGGWDNVTGQPLALPNNGVGGYIDPYGTTTLDPVGVQFFDVPAASQVVANVTLTAGAKVSGTIVDPLGLPVSNTSVSFQGVGSAYSEGVSTDSYGFYSYTATPGQYYVSVNSGWDNVTGQPLQLPNNGVGGYIDPYGNTTANQLNGQVFSLTVGSSTVANATLSEGALISGTILDATSLPLVNTQISLQGEAGSYFNAITDAYGFYSAVVAPDAYRIYINASYDPITYQPLPVVGVLGYIDPYGSTVADYWSANLFIASVGAPVVADATLATPSTISGTILDPLGLPVANANVSLQGEVGGYGYATTDAYGFYSAQVTADLYRINITGAYDPTTGQPLPLPNVGLAGYIDPYGATTADYFAANLFAVAAGSTTAADAQLTAGASIQGTIIDPLGIPVPNAQISLQGNGNYSNVVTDSYGFYSGLVAPDSYRIYIAAGYDYNLGQPTQLPNVGLAGYIDPYGNTTSDYWAANLFAVVVGGTTVADAQLTAGATIQGTILDPLGVPVSNAQISLQGNANYSNAVTDSYGFYSSVVSPDSYRINIYSGSNDPYTLLPLPLPNVGLAGYIDPYGNTTSNWSAANLFTAVSGGTTVADAQLTAGAIIQGTVLDPLGLPVANAVLYFNGSLATSSSTTDAYGFYSVIVSPDSYRINISNVNDPNTGQYISAPNGGLLGYIDALGNTTSNYAAANLFVTAAGATTVANVTLTQGFAIDVTVVDPSGLPLPNAYVIFDGLSYQGLYTNNQGVASVNVELGLYRIGVDTGSWSTPYIGGYLTTSGWLTSNYWYASQFDISSSTSFAVQMFNFVGDRDGDGVLDYLDSFPDDAMYSADTDLDHMADAWEIANFGNLTTADQFTDFNGNGVSDFQEFIAGTNPVTTASVRNDFNGDGTADILWRKTATNAVYIDTIVGSAVAASTRLGWKDPASWDYLGTGDFDGDGNADILWRKAATSAVYIDTIVGSAVATSTRLGWKDPASWIYLGTGDFDGDGNADILWRKAATSAVYIDTIVGNAVATSTRLGWKDPASWTYLGTGDFDGDGNADILWRKAATSAVYIDTIVGNAVATSTRLGWKDPASWDYLGTGDFDGDGNADILWRKAATSAVYIDTIVGNAVATSTRLGWKDPASWDYLGTGDFDGDGNADILWRKAATSAVYIDTIVGNAVATSTRLGWKDPASWSFLSK